MGLAVAVCLCVLPLGGVAEADAHAGLPVELPAAGVLTVPRVVARTAPVRGSRAVRVVSRFAADAQFRVVLAVAARRGLGGWWYQLSLPGRPNGQRGWVRGDQLDLHPVRNRIVIHVSARTLEVFRVATGRRLLRSVVAVGRPGAETPLGHDFYVQARAVSRDPFYGPFVFVTSAYSRLSEWPGGGLAGIHGTDEPRLLGQAVSHGCVRVSDAVDRALVRLAPLGTPVDLLR
jgi:hypothetical protein